MRRTLVALPVAAVVGVVGAAGGRAREPANGPAAPAAVRWFTTDRSLGCLDPQGRSSACSFADRDVRFRLYYGDASGAGAQADAVAIVGYQPAPPGNAFLTAVAYFHRFGNGYRFVRIFPQAVGLGLVEGTSVRFAPGKATFSMIVYRKNDGYCCPTGRATYTITLNPAGATPR